jgi:hypothetical protein
MSRGGGVAIIINKRINYKFLKSKATNDYEYIAIELISANEKITLINCYTHPNSKTYYNFIHYLIKLKRNKVIFVGDLNATNILWYCPSTNNRGKALEKICSENNLIIANNQIATYRKSQNIIDLVITSDSLTNRVQDFIVDRNFSESDHWPVKFNIAFKTGRECVSRTDWNKFTSDIDQMITNMDSHIVNNKDLETSTLELTRMINSCLCNNTKQVEIKNNNMNIPKEFHKLLDLKKQIHRRFSITHDPFLKNQLNNITNKIKRFNKRLSSLKWNDQCAFLAKKKPSERTY